MECGMYNQYSYEIIYHKQTKVISMPNVNLMGETSNTFLPSYMVHPYPLQSKFFDLNVNLFKNKKKKL